MNSIAIKSIETPYGYNEEYLIIDGISLPEWFEMCSDDKIKCNFIGLYPAWGADLEQPGDIRFVWSLIKDRNPTVLPLLVCEDDLDFTCIVLVAYVRKDEQYVYWDKIGYVTHVGENFEDEKRSGILHLEGYTDEDWLKYGDNIATAEVNSFEWENWISQNWSEELFRRRINYTEPYYKKDGSVKWLNKVGWIFERKEYDFCVSHYEKKLKEKY